VAGPNLVSTALAGLRAAGWNGPPVSISIDKRTPVAAGMGGGSADAAAALRLAGALDRVPDGVVEQLAASLGADVAAQLTPGVALGTGAGEIVQAAAALARHALLILPARVELSTAAVYREADRMGLGRSPAELARLRREVEAALRPGAKLPAELLVNDLQPAARSLCPAIEPALEDARGAGAEQAIVCGSGPTVAGVFWGEDAYARAAAAVTAVSDRYPGACAVSPVGESAGLPQFA
jgi:4-diphosphocytidyl-2-C-methyl-D-erythritol kinase